MKIAPDYLAGLIAQGATVGPTVAEGLANMTGTGRHQNQLPVKERKTAKQHAASPAPLVWSVSFTVPVKIQSEMNTRDHWTVRHKRFTAHKTAVPVAVAVQGLGGWRVPSWPIDVDLVRLGGQPMDQDNLAGGLKGIQDALAAIFGCDDGDVRRVRWEYGQTPADVAAVRVTVRGTIGPA